ncbi:hypothetical protein M378DRAFT_78703, partial [Amanita muscaria Koide BX008]
DDDGFILTESRTICYIATKYGNQGTKFRPANLKENSLFEEAASTETANFDAFAPPLAGERCKKRGTSGTRQ